MFAVLKNVGGFLHKNRNKIIVASVVAVAVAVYVQYNSASEANLIVDEDEFVGFDGADNENTNSRKTKSSKNEMSPGNRSRLLLRIRRQFDIASRHFMPTLRIKIIEVVDINGTVRQIKELRAKSSESNRQLEAQLWEEIKISSFSMLFVTAYMLSAVCVLLRLQLHILARSVYNSTISADNSFSFQQNDTDGSEIHLDNEMFRALVESTYRTMFGSGLKAFSSLVRHRIATDMKHWTVQDKLAVELGDLMETVNSVRGNIESDLASVVQTIFIGQDDPSLHTTTSSSSSSGSTNGSHYGEEVDSPYEHHVTGNTPAVQKLLNQTYDLLESPMFLSAYSEALDAAFRVIFASLRHNVFTPDNPSSYDALRTLPLASLLPQIKAVSARLLPVSLDTVVSPEIRDISSGPCLDAFCVAVFDAPENNNN